MITEKILRKNKSFFQHLLFASFFLPLLVWQSLPTITLIYDTVIVGEEHQQGGK
ncbi:MAG: hypothetical protein MUE72_03235 [Chitinophagaceae bacterium]|jgi:hypothetical protein|nr:hypothetical protein [Chitinophagaceae bacterium]